MSPEARVQGPGSRTPNAARAPHDGAPLLDLSNTACPLTFAKVSVALESLAIGDRLDVILDPGEPAADVPRSLRLHGHVVESTTVRLDGQVLLRVRKA